MIETGIPGVAVVDLVPHVDERGRFHELVRASDYPEHFVQSNHSRSKAGVLRGLHFHRYQADLWYVTGGKMQVALADLRDRQQRPAISTFVLDFEDPRTVYIPPGVAHGFLAITDVDLIYWVTREYDAKDEHGVRWDDPTLGVKWDTDDPILSDRDRSNPELRWDQVPSF
jgi:dTDP-4-dehydrorhamnose 3,5-epimerase